MGRSLLTTESAESAEKIKENALTEVIIGAAIEVHRELGPGLLESAYEECLARELLLREIAFERQKKLPIVYKGVHVKTGFRVDFIVAHRVIVELKAVDDVSPIHKAQVLTYLRLANCKLGILFNFNNKVLKDGIHRLALGL